MEDKDNFLSIGQVSTITGAHIKSLRYYDSIGVLKPAYINAETGYRYYTAAQLYTVEAIQLCLDLGVPLKAFSQFVDGQGRLRYDKLLAYGQRIAEKRMRTLQRSLTMIHRAQAEIDASVRYADRQAVYTRPFPQMRVLLIPVDDAADSFSHYAQMHRVYAQHEQTLTFGYTGGLLRDIDGETMRQYHFVELIDAPEDLPDTRILPKRERHCVMSAHRRIDAAAELFARPLAGHSAYTVLESELLTRDYDFRHQTFELSLLL